MKKKLITILLLIITGTFAFAANISELIVMELPSEADSIYFIKLTRAYNATTYTEADSAFLVKGTGSYDTTFQVDDRLYTIIRYMIEYDTLDDIGFQPWMNYYDYQPLVTLDNTVALNLKLDTMFAWAGYGIGNKSHTDYDTDNDSIWIVMNGTDTIGIMRYYHIEGAAGDPPDSVLNVAKP